jgi:hypothetical protein
MKSQKIVEAVLALLTALAYLHFVIHMNSYFIWIVQITSLNLVKWTVI